MVSATIEIHTTTPAQANNVESVGGYAFDFAQNLASGPSQATAKHLGITVIVMRDYFLITETSVPESTSNAQPPIDENHASLGMVYGD